MNAPVFPPAPEFTPVRRAMLSVYDKTGLVEMARTLVDLGVELICQSAMSGRSPDFPR